MEAHANGFPLVSEATDDPHVEDLYRVSDGRWQKHGRPIGTATVDESEPGGGDVELTVRLDIDRPPGMVTLTGRCTRDGDRLRRGELRVVEAKGFDAEPGETIILNVRNPKRWARDDDP